MVMAIISINVCFYWGDPGFNLEIHSVAGFTVDKFICYESDSTTTHLLRKA